MYTAIAYAYVQIIFEGNKVQLNPQNVINNVF